MVENDVKSWWLDPTAVSINRLPISAIDPPAHARQLDEGWRFLLLDEPDDLPDGAADFDYDDSQWAPIEVPSNWQLTDAGNSDIPIYTNVQYPVAGRPANGANRQPNGPVPAEVHLADGQ